MNLIILAAGSGKRLYPLTKDRPKSLLDIGDGSTLLDRQLATAVESDCINKVYIITGYLHNLIEDAVKPYRADLEIQTIYNPYFDVSNALLSLWCANFIMEEDDFFVSNGDNIYKTNIFDAMDSQSDNQIRLAISEKKNYDADDMKIAFTAEQTVGRVSKEIHSDDADAESVGLVLVKGLENRRVFKNALISAAKNRNYFNAFWQQAFDFVVRENTQISTFKVGADEWAEIDFHPDVELMRKALFGNL